MRISAILLLFFLFSCEGKKSNTEIEVRSKSSDSQKNKQTFNQIQEIASLSFRRSYVGHENLSDKELDKLYKSNPTLETYDSKLDLVKRLNEKKLLLNSELILSQFKNKIIVKDYLDTNKKITIVCNYDTEDSSIINLNVTKDTQSIFKSLDFKGDHILGIILKDIDDDGIKEILIVTNYYIMNGDNFVVTILKYS
jgi:capsule polysaccharide export protein KpsE/RkpR